MHSAGGTLPAGLAPHSQPSGSLRSWTWARSRQRAACPWWRCPSRSSPPAPSGCPSAYPRPAPPARETRERPGWGGHRGPAPRPGPRAERGAPIAVPGARPIPSARGPGPARPRYLQVAGDELVLLLRAGHGLHGGRKGRVSAAHSPGRPPHLAHRARVASAPLGAAGVCLTSLPPSESQAALRQSEDGGAALRQSGGGGAGPAARAAKMAAGGGVGRLEPLIRYGTFPWRERGPAGLGYGSEGSASRPDKQTLVL